MAAHRPKAELLAAVTVKANPRLADSCRSTALATPNYSYEKRQRELAKKRKVEEKRQRKVGKVDGDGQPVEGGEAGENPDGGAPAEPGSGDNTPPAAA
jgi:hypothetical protein